MEIGNSMACYMYFSVDARPISLTVLCFVFFAHDVGDDLTMWQCLYSAGIALYLVGNYPEWREGIFSVVHDTLSLFQWLVSRGVSGIPAQPALRTVIRHDLAAIWTPTELSEFKSRTKALMAVGTIATESYETYHGDQIRLQLPGMAGMVGGVSDPFIVMTECTSLGFARVVWDFVALKVGEYRNDGEEHCFFVFHPDNAWMGAFMRLERVEGPLPFEFVGVAHDLFVLCRWMLCVRVALVQAMGDAGRKVHFHILIPTSEPLVIPRPFSFTDGLYPLTVEGPTRRGRALVWLRVVAKQAGLLKDIGAVPSPCHVSAERKACVAVCIVWVVVSPVLVMVCKVLCSPNTPFYMTLALTTIFHGLALVATLWLKREVKDYYLLDELPATLG
ncbi:hypothetical protein NOR_05239 [Metarhizium rileyi]|uniref:Transmembrane protein n=1 Tax=Metarhizium rileyi (strain RCEF 4871) TaxID=1649241 RepID=A0A167CYG3_METRR|nr:hypothetical protein NOR_05239 [Metarhizium rileyi RCEF 4871]